MTDSRARLHEIPHAAPSRNRAARQQAGADAPAGDAERGRAAPRHWSTVRTGAGEFITTGDEGVVRALGIRYASAERFGAPSPYAYGEEPFLADTPSPACPQVHKPTDTELVALGFDEHCQRLSVTRPDTEETGLPVLVWIHGGSYTAGAADLPYYDPRWLVEEQNVVVVSVTYRLGLFGYLGDGEAREANPGLLDQVEALKWVHRNIGGFGGDPGRITIAGQSAGGHACWDLLYVEELRGMISRAIVQSAPLGIVFGRHRALKALTPSAGATESMRRASARELADGRIRIDRLAFRQGLAKFMPFTTRYGARPLPPESELPRRWRELAGSVEVLMGTTSREVSLFTGVVPPLQRLAADPRGSRWVVEPLIRALTRKVYGRQCRRWARLFRRAGGAARTYTFVYGRPGLLLSCCHLSELPLLFPSPAWGRGVEEAGAGVTGPEVVATYDPETVEEAGRALRAAWGAFIREGADAVEPIPGVLDLD
ncbi:carboxylesterase family protein [Rothia halotolerans]|uniref:carboxylesterase family protein n=1 Tax=Rothia halotolerans TaxID=405770 RepID=UPI0013EE3BB0|nr:carboxylesterase family protein [Rothia halotolerans]